MLPPPFEGSLVQCTETGSFLGMFTGFNACFKRLLKTCALTESIAPRTRDPTVIGGEATRTHAYRQLKEPIRPLPRFSVQRVTPRGSLYSAAQVV